MWTKKRLIAVGNDSYGLKGWIVLTGDNGFETYFGSNIDRLIHLVVDDFRDDVDDATEDHVLKFGREF